MFLLLKFEQENLQTVFEIFTTDAGQLSGRLKLLAGQNKILQDRRLVCYQITISFCQKSQDICQTNWNFLQDWMKICWFCQTVLQFLRRLYKQWNNININLWFTQLSNYDSNGSISLSISSCPLNWTVLVSLYIVRLYTLAMHQLHAM